MEAVEIADIFAASIAVVSIISIRSVKKKQTS
jgi:hypothetical protein